MSDQTFYLLEDAGPTSVARWWPEISGLAAALYCTAKVLPASPAMPPAQVELWMHASRCAIPVFTAAAIVAYLAGVWTAGREHREAVDAAAGLAAAASWLPAAVLFFRHNSPWTIPLGAVLPAAVTRAVLLRIRTSPRSGCITLPAAVAAAALETAVAASSARDWRLAASALSLAGAFTVWILTSRGHWPPPVPRRRPRVYVVPALMIGLLFSAEALISPSLHSAQPAEPGPDAIHAERWLQRRPLPLVEIGEGYPAVILWPPVETFTTLVAPAPALVVPSRDTRRLPPAGIPFSGFYSFQRPAPVPPEHWYVTRGDPAHLSFRTTDHRPLLMAAEQSFGIPVDLSCCREIHLLVRVADARPHTVQVELLLRDDRVPGRPAFSLGVSPLVETMVYRVPRPSPLREFDHATVRFQLGGPRWDRSALIALRSFCLVP